MEAAKKVVGRTNLWCGFPCQSAGRRDYWHLKPAEPKGLKPNGFEWQPGN